MGIDYRYTNLERGLEALSWATDEAKGGVALILCETMKEALSLLQAHTGELIGVVAYRGPPRWEIEFENGARWLYHSRRSAWEGHAAFAVLTILREPLGHHQKLNLLGRVRYEPFLYVETYR